MYTDNVWDAVTPKKARLNDNRDIVISMYVGRSDSTSAGVTITLTFAGVEENKNVYDFAIEVNNDDNQSPRQCADACSVAVDWFYEQGLTRKYGRIVGVND